MIKSASEEITYHKKLAKLFVVLAILAGCSAIGQYFGLFDAGFPFWVTAGLMVVLILRVVGFQRKIERLTRDSD